MLEKYKGIKKYKPYLIFGLCDESFSINCTANIPHGVDHGLFMFYVTLLNQIYWVAGSTLGGIFGSVLKFNTEGLDFVMTAMFAVIFVEHWKSAKTHIPAVCGLFISLVCLCVFGADNFMIPTMLAILAVLTVLRSFLEK